MGQYYYGIMNCSFDGEGKPVAFCNIEAGYLKLMEHSWWGNYYVNWFCRALSQSKFRVGWVGDYSDSQGCPEDIFMAAHGFDKEDDPNPKYTETIAVSESHFTLNGKILANHTKKQYLDCNKYYKEASKYDDVWIVHPLPILTCIGNGLGGGDYRGINQDKVGIWFWDILEVTELVPAGYSELDVIFAEKSE